MQTLVTGGAGFIGSHLVDALLDAGHRVRVVDDLSTGLASNLSSEAELVTGDITNQDLLWSAMDGVEIVFHQAARTSVPRSVEDPLASDHVNTHGTLSVLNAARLGGARRVVSASSSSVYGGVAPLPATESFPAAPRSPYAVSKYAGELYSRVFTELYGLETVCLRYFNVYGPRQRADSPYAAVIPKFIDVLRSGRRPVVYGDGLQTRAFTFVSDAVTANILAASAPAGRCAGRSFNVSGGERHSLLDLLAVLAKLMDVVVEPEFADPRAGDVRDSEADLDAIRVSLGFEPATDLEEGLRRLLDTRTDV